MNNFKKIVEEVTSTQKLDESTDIANFKNTGQKENQTLDVNQYSGGKDKGIMMQVTQGMGKYIQLSPKDAAALGKTLTAWAKKQKK